MNAPIIETPVRALIVDDEPLARAHLRRMLEAQGITVVGEAQNGLVALQMTEDLKPDLMLLDIQMPGMTGMQLAQALMQLEPAPIIIFVTGYSEHALQAFEIDALDYVVKPVSSERLELALARARSRLADLALRSLSETAIASQSRATPLKRIPVRDGYSVHLVRIEDIFCATSRSRRVYLWTEGKEYRTYYTLSQLEEMLPPDVFMRIHDSAIVHLDRVEEIMLLGNHSYMVRLSNSHQIPVGRSRYSELQRRLGMDSSIA